MAEVKAMCKVIGAVGTLLYVLACVVGVSGCTSNWGQSMTALDAEETWRLYLWSVRSGDLVLCRRLMTDRAAAASLMDRRIELVEKVQMVRAMVIARYGGDAGEMVPKASDVVEYPRLPGRPIPPLERRSSSLYVIAGRNTALRRTGGRWRVGLHAVPTHRVALAEAVGKEVLEEKMEHIQGMLALLRRNEAGSVLDVRKRLFSLSQGRDPTDLLADDEFKQRLRYMRQQELLRALPWTEFSEKVRGRLLPHNEGARENPAEMVRSGDNAIVMELQDSRSYARKRAFLRDFIVDESFLLSGIVIPVPSDEVERLRRWSPEGPGFFQVLELKDDMIGDRRSFTVRYRIRAVPKEGEGRPIVWITDPISIRIVDDGDDSS